MRSKLLVSLLALLCLQPNASGAFRVVVDPGHGGSDHGAVRNGLKESDVVLSVSENLLELLKGDPSFAAHTTRTSSKEELSLKDRVQIAEEFKADIFLSVHANASTDSRVKGVEFYFSPALSGQEATLLLNHLSVQAQSELSTKEDNLENDFKSDTEIILHALKDQHRGWESQELSRKLWSNWNISGKRKTVRQAPFFVVNSNKIPAVLVEIGYLSNSAERKSLTDPAHQRQVAEQIFQGLKQFKEFMDNSRSTDLE